MIKLKRLQLSADAPKPGDKIIFEGQECLVGNRSNLYTANFLNDDNKTENLDGSVRYSISQDSHLPKSTDFFDGFHENDVLEYIFKYKHHFMIFEELFENKKKHVHYCLETKEPILEKYSQSKPGDLDIIAFQEPNQAIAIECKWIKHFNQNGILSKWNKTQKIKKAWKQLSGYRKLGFHKTYLLLIIADDQSDNINNSQFFKKLQNPELSLMPYFEENSSGILILTFSKISHASFHYQHRATISTIRSSVKDLQKDRITNVFKETLNYFENNK